MRRPGNAGAGALTYDPDAMHHYAYPARAVEWGGWRGWRWARESLVASVVLGAGCAGAGIGLRAALRPLAEGSLGLSGVMLAMVAAATLLAGRPAGFAATAVGAIGGTFLMRAGSAPESGAIVATVLFACEGVLGSLTIAGLIDQLALQRARAAEQAAIADAARLALETSADFPGQLAAIVQRGLGAQGAAVLGPPQLGSAPVRASSNWPGLGQDVPISAIRDGSQLGAPGIAMIVPVPGATGEPRGFIAVRDPAPRSRERALAFLDTVAAVSGAAGRRLEAEAARLGSEQRFRQIANAAPVFIWMTDRDGQLTFANHQWLAFRGRALEEEMGEGWLEAIHPGDRAARAASFETALRSRGSFASQFRLRRGDGEYRWVLDHGDPLFSPSGEFEGYVGSCIEIHKQKATEEGLRLLADTSASVLAPAEYPAVLRDLARHAVEGFADWCTITVVERDGPNGVAGAHHDAGMEPVLERLLANREEGGRLPLVEHVVASGESIFAPEIEREALRASALSAEHYAIQDELDPCSGICMPLSAHGRTFGAMVFIRTSASARFEAEHLRLAEEFANRAALAIENARLRQERERATAQLQLLADAGAELARSLELDETLHNVAQLIVPRFADWCTIDLIEPDGTLRRPVQLHPDPERIREALAYRNRFADQPVRFTDYHRKLLRGEPMFIPQVTRAFLEEVSKSPEQVEAAERMALRSLIVVPLRARERLIGAVSFVYAESGRSYDGTDFEAAQQLARRIALSIDNARILAEERKVEEELRKASRAKDDFMGMMSHELRTPLTVINGGARVLLERSTQLDEQARKEVLVDIEQESDRLFRMVENLLALAHLDYTAEIALEPLLLNRVVDQVVATFRERRPGRPVRVTIEPGLAPVAAETTYVEQVLRNLLSNADKYSAAGKPVDVCVFASGRYAVIAVKDRGMGIAPEEAERIFERFYRSERTAKLVGGSGVGLALTRRLVEAMGGTVWAYPRDGGGLEVGFMLESYEEGDL